MGPSLFLGALLLLVVAAGGFIFWPRPPRKRDSTFSDHTSIDYDPSAYGHHDSSSSHDGSHDS